MIAGQQNAKLRLAQSLTSLQSTLRLHRFEAQAGQAATLLAQLSTERAATVVVVGEFNAGKSTLINAICGVEVLPSGIIPTTATVNVVSHSPTELLCIHYHDGRVVELPLRLENLKRLTARYGEQSDIKLVEIYLPGAPRGLVLMDTPGVNDINETRAEIVYGSMLTADSVVMLLDAQQPMKRSEVDFLRNRVLGNSLTRAVFVLNHVDRLTATSDVRTVVEYSRHQIGLLYREIARDFRGRGNSFVADRLERIAESVPLFCVSAKRMLHARLHAQPLTADEGKLARLFEEMGSQDVRQEAIVERIGAQALALAVTFQSALRNQKVLAEAARQQVAEVGRAHARLLRNEAQKARVKLGKIRADGHQILSEADRDVRSVFARAGEQLKNCQTITPDFCQHIQESIAREIESVLQRMNSKLEDLSRGLIASISADVRIASASFRLARNEPSEPQQEDRFDKFLADPTNQMLIYLVGPFVIWSLGWIGLAAAAIPFIAHLFGNASADSANQRQQFLDGLQHVCTQIQSELNLAVEKRLNALASVALRPIDELQVTIMAASRELCGERERGSLRVMQLDDSIGLAEKSAELISNCLVDTK